MGRGREGRKGRGRGRVGAQEKRRRREEIEYSNQVPFHSIDLL